MAASLGGRARYASSPNWSFAWPWRIPVGATRAFRARSTTWDMMWDEAPSPNVLKREGIEPAPERGGRTSWSVFLKAHWRSIVAADFFATEVWSWRGLVTYYVLFVIELAKRIVHIAGITTQPNEGWIMQVARRFTDGFNGFLIGKSHLIVDRDTNYTAQ